MKPYAAQIDWVDSKRLMLGWDLIGEYRHVRKRGLECRTVGLLIAKAKGHVVVALSMNPAGTSACDAMVIPRSAIRKTRRLRAA